LFGIEAAKIIYAISYLKGITFNWVKTDINDFMAYKNNNRKINTLAREPTQRIFTNYEIFKTNI
jgi:hypothetical protein